MTAPLQVIAVSFTPDADFEGRILDEVDRLRGRGVLRVLDMLFVAKGTDGTLERLSIGGDDEDFGALLSGIVPTDGGELAERGSDDGDGSGFDPEQAWALADALLPGARHGLAARRAPLGRAAVRGHRRDGRHVARRRLPQLERRDGSSGPRWRPWRRQRR